jgi:hypothetical protein
MKWFIHEKNSDLLGADNSFLLSRSFLDVCFFSLFSF